jgi:hypothetical protein
MDLNNFRARFKEELNIRYQSAESKYNKNCDDYNQGRMDEIDSVEILFDKVWKECEKEDNDLIVIPDDMPLIKFK